MATTNRRDRLRIRIDPDGEEAIQIAKISVELRSGTARFAVAVQAPTTPEALNIVASRYPGHGVRVRLLR